jgi:hypothetical protein
MRVNGNIQLNALGQSEIQNLVVERVSATPAFNALEAGRLVYNTSDRVYYMNSGQAWAALATGGNAAGLQIEVDRLETSLGGAVTAAGSFNPGAFTGNNIIGASSITDAINQLDASITGKNELRELIDVAIGTASDGQVLMFSLSSGKWVNHTPVLADLSNITTTAAEVNQLHSAGTISADFVKLHAVTASATDLNILEGTAVTKAEINYVHGVDAPIQTQLDGKQPLDAQLTSISSLTPGNGDVLVGKADGTYELLTGAGFRSKEGLVIGQDIQAYDADLQQIASFTPTPSSTETIGSIMHTGVNDFLVSTGGPEGTRWSIQRGVVARTSLGLGDIAIHDDAEYVRVDGLHTMAADLNLNSHQIVGLSTPVISANAATKGYVDALVAGLAWKNAARVLSETNITLSGLQTIDGVVLAAGDRVLVKGQANPAQNGVYVAASTAWVRSADMDDPAEFPGTGLWVEEGNVFGNTGWVCNTHAPVTVGTTAITFVQFNGATGIDAGIGLSKVGNTLAVNMGAGIVQLPSDQVGIDLYDVASGAIIMTLNGTSRSTDENAQLHLLLDQEATGALTQGPNGLKIGSNAVSPYELSSAVAGDGLIGGDGTALSVASAPGTAGTVGTLVVTSDTVGVALGNTSTTAASGDHIHSADEVSFDNSISQLDSSPNNVKSAIDALAAGIGTVGTDLTALSSVVDNVRGAVGLTETGTLPDYTGDILTGSSTIIEADKKLRNAIVSINDSVRAAYFLYSGSAATVHTVNHNIGTQYCNVTVIDSATDEQVIPQSVTFDSMYQLTVTFNQAISARVVVMGQSKFIIEA